jgi:malate permease and related proteins
LLAFTLGIYFVSMNNHTKVRFNWKLLLNPGVYSVGIGLIILYILLQFNFQGSMLGVPVIIVGMPVAANSVMLAKEYGGDDILASEGVFVSTSLSVGSIVFLAYVLSLVG